MKLVRFLAQSFVGGRIHYPGDEALVADDLVLEAHMMLPDTGKTGDRPAAGGFHVPLYLDHSHIIGIPPSPMPPGIATEVEADK